MKSIKGIIIFITFGSLIVFLLIVTNNTIKTNGIIQKSITNLFDQYQDSTITHGSMENFKNEVLLTKDYILDSNTISYLFEVLTILIIGIGFYLLSNIQEKINIVNREIENVFKHKKNVDEFLGNLKFTFILFNKLDVINLLAIDLDENNVLSDVNIQKSFIIESQLDEFILIVKENRKCSLYKKDISHLNSIFKDHILRKTSILSKKDNYYNTVYEKLEIAMDSVNSIEVFDVSVNNNHG